MFFSVMGLLAVAACEKAPVTPETEPQKEAEFYDVRIAPVMTKVTQTAFEEGDAIGVTITRTGGVYANNEKMSFDGSVFSGSLKWYAEGAEGATLAAYYPYSAGGSSSFAVQADQSAGTSASDFVAGIKEGVLPSAHAVTVPFKHKLSAIGELSTYSYEYEGEAEMEYDRDWVVLNFLTDTEIDIEYRGVIKAGISIDQVGIEVDNELMIIFISLPRPQILSNEIEMTAYDADVDVFGKVDGDDASTLLEVAKMDELDRAIADGLLVEASANAEQIITDLLSVYDDYEIRFLFTDREIREEMQ